MDIMGTMDKDIQSKVEYYLNQPYTFILESHEDGGKPYCSMRVLELEGCITTGDTIEEVNESLKNALALVERVRQEMEAEASRTKVPAGAPQRAPLDLSELSPREKIKYAMGGPSSSRG